MKRAAGSSRVGAAGAHRVVRSLLHPSNLPVLILAIVLLIGALVFVALGGLAPARDSARRADAGEEVRTSLYAVTVVGAALTDEVEDQYISAEEDEDLLVVTLRLENLTSRPIGVQDAVDGVNSRLVGHDESMLALADVTPTDGVSVWRDGSRASPILQPGVPAEVHVSWPVPEGSLPDGIVRLDVYDAWERAGKIIVSSTDITWHRTERAARVFAKVSR